MSQLPSCTVLLIAYRMQHTIAESLRSVLAQDVPCEIIVSDDCSGDESLSVARDVMKGYTGPHRVTIRSTAQNLGLCAHLNELAGLATGEVLVFQAGDDVARPDRVERLLEEFVAHPQAQVVGSAVDDIDERGRLLAESVRGMPRRLDQRAFLRRGRMQTVLGASMAVRRELITGMPALHGFVEDNMLSLRAALVGECRCLPQALLGYRRHGGNLNDWMFDRSDHDYSTYERRNRRVLTMYRQIAADQERCAEARPDLPAERRRLALALAAMYRLEADMREALLDRPRYQWVRLLWRGLRHPGLHRKSAERGLKLLLPRRWFGRGAQIRGYLGS
ncbi:MAG TPA: glycosyltransferase [Frateuria sp.]|uniref:glycosyltransferase n=1 Tax=Frateuria sp. TaxID=2211372 RepID=UPI002DED5737|nr:glycosyltransferase [Frateuria sp.]